MKILNLFLFFIQFALCYGVNKLEKSDILTNIESIDRIHANLDFNSNIITELTLLLSKNASLSKAEINSYKNIIKDIDISSLKECNITTQYTKLCIGLEEFKKQLKLINNELKMNEKSISTLQNNIKNINENYITNDDLDNKIKGLDIMRKIEQNENLMKIKENIEEKKENNIQMQNIIFEEMNKMKKYVNSLIISKTPDVLSDDKVFDSIPANLELNRILIKKLNQLVSDNSFKENEEIKSDKYIIDSIDLSKGSGEFSIKLQDNMLRYGLLLFKNKLQLIKNEFEKIPNERSENDRS